MESLTNRKKVVSDKPMTFMEKLYLPAIFKGMFITLKHMFKKNNTIKYPVSDLTEVTLSDKYQIKPPTFLGQAHIEDDVNLISDDDIFTEVGEGDYIFYKLTKDRLLEWGRQRQEHSSKSNQHLIQGLSGVKDIKILINMNFFEVDFLIINVEKNNQNKPIE